MPVRRPKATTGRRHGVKGVLLLSAVVLLLGAVYAFWNGKPEEAAAPPDAIRPGAELPFEATAYCTRRTTTAGAPARRGIVAADISLLPVGSVIQIQEAGEAHDGIYTVMEGGRPLQGREIDIYLGNCSEAEKFGRRNVTVTIMRLGWQPEQSR